MPILKMSNTLTDMAASRLVRECWATAQPTKREPVGWAVAQHRELQRWYSATASLSHIQVYSEKERRG
ncbi:hypothetical protein SAE02_68460 [Skermanella aerolata]|uniref:Uncharacterized protein n=1 Tax=Skermanella aerolata TaxID=393310 RepID=A0A512E1V4_9PROT|nr:hypothetical protein SAE02_68460 [Skermanella aerolata]